jgi:hypothetical protein
MNEPKRLMSDGSPFERSLLDAGRDEAPSRALEARILASFEAAPLSPSADVPPRAPRDFSLARLMSPRGLVLAVGVVGLGAALVGVMGDGTPPSPAPPAASARNVVARAPESPPPPVPDDRRSETTPKPEVTFTPDSLPSAPPERVAAPSGTGSVASTPVARGTQADASPSIEREVALLDAVRSKLEAGAAGEAARALDVYDAEIPNGALRPEATVLRIRTLLLQGSGAAARAMADDFLAKNPTSVHAKRIRALLDR